MSEVSGESTRFANEVPRIRQPNAAYHRARDIPTDDEVISVGRGTDGGEYLRRTWQPVCLSEELGDVPKVVRLLDEELVLFRTRSGELGLIEKHCSHRGASLEYGLPTDDGIQCCYHGWRFDAEGTCTCIPSLTEDQNFELNRIKVPHYPTHEISGCIWIFMPSDFRTMEVKAIPATVPDVFSKPAMSEKLVFPCHIDHAVIGLMDPAHGPFVHQSWWWRSRKSIYTKSKEFGPTDLGFAMLKHSPSSNSLAIKYLAKIFRQK